MNTKTVSTSTHTSTPLASTTTTITNTPAGADVAEGRSVAKDASAAIDAPHNESSLENIAHNVADGAKNLAEDAKEKASDLVDGIKEKATDIKDDIEERKEEAEAEREAEIEAKAAEPEYNLTVEEAVVEKITSLAAQKIDGIIDMKGNVLSMIQEGFGGNDDKKGVSASVIDNHHAKVDLDVILEYGKSAASVFEEMKEVITEDVKSMTDLDVIEMNVRIVDVMSHDEFEQKKSGGLSSLASFFTGDDDTPIDDTYDSHGERQANHQQARAA